MTRARLVLMSIAAVIATRLVACDSAPTLDGAHHDEARRHGAAHDGHRGRHDDPPCSVVLAPDVIEQAGIKTAPATRERLSPTVRLFGEIAPTPNREASVAARVDGVIETIRVRVGDVVARDEVLATVRAPNLQSLRAAETAMRSKATSARANADRLSALLDRGMTSQQEALAADAEADALEAEARAARERLRALGVNRSRGAVSFDVRAPVAGVVIKRGVMAGAPVTSDSVVATLVSTDDVWFLARVFDRDVARVSPGSPARVYLNAFPDEALTGVVEYVSHQVDPGAHTLSARIPLANPDGRLRLGLYGTAQVIADGVGERPVLAVPNAAITRLRGRTVAFVRSPDGPFELRELVLGESDARLTEVVRGLHEGEQVVTEGAFTIKSALLRGTFGEDHH